MHGEGHTWETFPTLTESPSFLTFIAAMLKCIEAAMSRERGVEVDGREAH